MTLCSISHKGEQFVPVLVVQRKWYFNGCFRAVWWQSISEKGKSKCYKNVAESIPEMDPNPMQLLYHWHEEKPMSLATDLSLVLIERCMYFHHLSAVLEAPFPAASASQGEDSGWKPFYRWHWALAPENSGCQWCSCIILYHFKLFSPRFWLQLFNSLKFESTLHYKPEP